MKFTEKYGEIIFFHQSIVCKVLSSGVALVIDITWDPTINGAIGSIRANNVPYIHIDISIKPFARAFFKFIDYINSYDVAMILQNEKGILHCLCILAKMAL